MNKKNMHTYLLNSSQGPNRTAPIEDSTHYINQWNTGRI